MVRGSYFPCLLPAFFFLHVLFTFLSFFAFFCCLQYFPDSGTRGRREGTGSTEATEMILNNLFYITAKVTLHEINFIYLGAYHLVSLQ